MNAFRSVRPSPDEYNGFYAGYINAVPEGDISQILLAQKAEVLRWINQLTTEAADYRYEPGKWSAKEVVGHMIDTEWIFSYRALWFARGDQSPLPGMDPNVFMAGANFADRSLQDLRTEFSSLRSASFQLVSSFSEEILNRTGVASGFTFSVRAMSWIIAGHCQHHLHILNERYNLR